MEIVAIVFGFIAALGLGVAAYLYGKLQNVREVLEVPEETPEPEIDYSDPEPEEVKQVLELRVDPENPPRAMVYNPAEGFNGVYLCSCHRQKIERGQSIIWWPNPDTEGVELYCEESVQSVERVDE